MTELALLAPDADEATGLVLRWLAGKKSEHTRKAYARDLGILPQVRASRAPTWLAWCREVGTDPVRDVSEDLVALYARALDASGLSAASAARKLCSVSSWCTWLADRGYLSANPAAKVARPDVDPDTSVTPGLTKAEALAMIGQADRARSAQQERAAAIITVMLFTGARVSEICGADIEDLGVDRGHRVLRVTRKGGKLQALALPVPATERLDIYLATRADVTAVPAIPGQEGAPSARRVLFTTASGARMFAADVWRLVRRIAKAAGLPAELIAHLCPHAMRHSFATLYLDSGGSLRDLQDAMGHADPRTTRRYDRSRESLDRSPGYTLATYLAA